MNQIPARHGEPWDDEERLNLIRDFQNGATLLHLVKSHQRSPVAIQCKLERLGYTDFTMYNKNFWPGQPYSNSAPSLPTRFGRVAGHITGRFWMVQSADVSDKRDAFDRATVHWPGRSIFETKADAIAAAKAMAERHPSGRFFVMEAVSMFETQQPPVKCTTFRR